MDRHLLKAKHIATFTKSSRLWGRGDKQENGCDPSTFQYLPTGPHRRHTGLEPVSFNT